MSEQPPPAYNEEYASVPTTEGPSEGIAVIAQPPPPQQQQVVYVNQYGQPIQPPQNVQYVVVQNPNATPQQQQPQQVQYGQGIEVQQNPQNPAQQAVELQTQNNNKQLQTEEIYNTQSYAPKDDNHKWINDDELPPDYESIIAGENEPVAPKKGMGYIDGCLATPHLKAWFFTVVVLFFIICYFICLFTLYDGMCSCDCSYSFYSVCDETDIETCDSYDLECDFPCSMTYALGAGFWGIPAAAYLFYLCEVFFCSSSFTYLRNVHEQETIYKYVERLHTYPPNIWWKVECYHYETRTRTVTDSDGNTRTETYQEKVVTHTATGNYIYNTWKDVSAPLRGLDEWNLTKLKNYKTFTFANAETENDYNYKAAEFRRNNDRDTYQNFWYGVEIQDFKNKLLVEVHPGARSSTISVGCYVISSLILCTTCFRMHFASVCGRKKYVFNKQVSI